MIECSVCLNDILDEELCLLECEHLFCHKCLNTWLSIKRECPLCRVAIDKFKFKNEINRIIYIEKRIIESRNTTEIQDMNEIQRLINDTRNSNLRNKKLSILIRILFILSFFSLSSNIYLCLYCSEEE